MRCDYDNVQLAGSNVLQDFPLKFPYALLGCL